MNRAAQIAAGLRERIVTGQLAPGHPVPSTRALMRDHNVAMATASRVLALLQADGLIESKAGRGSVVLAPDRAAPDVLTTDRVVAAAIGIADAESLDAVSMRRLAAHLAIPTMALYRYLPSRGALERAMHSRVLGELTLPPPSGRWRTDLHNAARQLWAAMSDHPWLAGAMSMTRPEPLPAAMPLAEYVMAALRGSGSDPVSAFTDYLSLVNLVRGIGLTLEPEQADRAETGVSNDEWMDTRIAELRRITPADRFPAMAELIEIGYPYDADRLFDNTLARYLDGLAVRATANPGPADGG